MKERPILFSGPMVRALLAGTKKQTRRVLKPQPKLIPPVGQGIAGEVYTSGWFEGGSVPEYVLEKCPFGVAGDRLWVRESLVEREGVWRYAADGARVELAADDHRFPAMVSWAHHKEGSSCPSIHMPRWASRIALEVAGVRVERLQSVSEKEAKAEGVERVKGRILIGADGRETERSTYRASFGWLWEEINGKRPGCSWRDNPWVWVVSFARKGD